MSECPLCGSRESVWHHVLQRQMCTACGNHWVVVRTLPAPILNMPENGPPTPYVVPSEEDTVVVEAEWPGCCNETFDCVYDGPCYCSCRRCQERFRNLIECTCKLDVQAGILILVDDCPYHDENGRIINPVRECPEGCRCMECIGYREVDTR